jgi:hypothetical protein
MHNLERFPQLSVSQGDHAWHAGIHLDKQGTKCQIHQFEFYDSAEGLSSKFSLILIGLSLDARIDNKFPNVYFVVWTMWKPSWVQWQTSPLNRRDAGGGGVAPTGHEEDANDIRQTKKWQSR